MAIRNAPDGSVTSSVVALAPRVHGYDAPLIEAAITQLSQSLGWFGDDGPFGSVIRRGDRVVIKPNWVHHENQGPWGVEALYTAPQLIRTVTEAALRTAAESILVGDAPLQSCDFERLVREANLESWSDELARSDPRFKGLRDFRRTRSQFKKGLREASEDQLPLHEFVLFDLGSESLLEPVSNVEDRFRVTQYDPARLRQTHRRGRHQYLVARDVIAADVVINLPKLKTHKKAGLTCALKNLIGINGNKEYLPHHRLGGAETGGDCYPGRSRVKRALEAGFDQLNRAQNDAVRRGWLLATRALSRLSHARGDELGVEGSWWGNDTIWRTCLDLNRILLYGQLDGTLADVPQRRVLTIVDAVTAGQGDGPLSPQPLALGVLFAGENSAAVDLVGCELLRYEPDRIPIVREAFTAFRWPLVSFRRNAVRVTGPFGSITPLEAASSVAPTNDIVYAVGWKPAATSLSGQLTTSA
jgi:uncharacterized protein (DUF362 family)